MFGKSRLSTICYYVSDIDRTEAFYRNVLGLATSRLPDEESGTDWLIATTANDVELIFFEQESRPGNSPIAVFEVPPQGIDQVVTGLAEQKVTIVTPVSHAPGGWSAEFADPDGHIFSVYQPENMPRT